MFGLAAPRNSALASALRNISVRQLQARLAYPQKLFKQQEYILMYELQGRAGIPSMGTLHSKQLYGQYLDER